MNIKMLKMALLGLILSVSGYVHAGVIYSYDVTYDGSNFIFDNNNSWDNLSFNMGDSLDITLMAAQGDHWKWLSGSNEWYANIYDSCNSNTGLSEWSFSNNGLTVGSGSHNLTQGCVHFGPQNALNLNNGTLFDKYQFNYTYQSGANTVLDTSHMYEDSLGGWSFNDDVRFEYIDANINEVPEPSTIAIFALGIMGLTSRCSLLAKKNSN